MMKFSLKNFLNKKLKFNSLYYSALKFFFRTGAEVKEIDFSSVGFELKDDLLKIKEPEYKTIRPRYVLIRNLEFRPGLKVRVLPTFKNLIKWKSAHFDNTVIVRNYNLAFQASHSRISNDSIVIEPKVFVNKKGKNDIGILEKPKINEEIVKVLPYIKSTKIQTLFRLPIRKSPLYKSYFTEEQMNYFRQELADQNGVRKSKVELYEIYDKFNTNIFSNIRQVSGSKDLNCFPNAKQKDSKISRNYFLLLGKRKDTGQMLKALVSPETYREKTDEDGYNK